MTTTRDQAAQGVCEWQAFLAGLIVGGAAAILFAPYNGRELRSRIKEQARIGSDAVVDAMGKATEAVGKAMENAQGFVGDVPALVEKGKERLRSEGARMASAVDAARNAYSESARS